MKTIILGSYENWLKQKEVLTKKVSNTESKLLKISGKHPGGITPDKIKFSSPFKKAKADFNKAFKELQVFNRKSPKEYLKKSSWRNR